jgi:hypothetical protein
MEHPPEFLDGARVLQFASLSLWQPTGGTRHVVDGVGVNRFAALAVARYDNDPSVYLFYCDDDWNVVADTQHEDVPSAIQQANFEFGLLQFRDAATPE